MTHQAKEYNLYRQIAAYLRLQYPKAYFHFDYAGANLSKAQAGQMKVIQHSRGFPDLMILLPTGSKLFLELKAEGTRLFNKWGEPANDHIAEQLDWLGKLNECSFTAAHFAVGFDQAKELIDAHMNC